MSEGRRKPADEIASASSVPISMNPLYDASGLQNGDGLEAKGQSGDEAFYHTLENTDVMAKNNEQVYEEASKNGEHEPFYNVLEGPWL